LEQLENWYYLGGIKDFTKYTIADFEFSRIKPYKKINFEFEKSECFLNKRFYDNNLREFGDLTYAFNNDGADYTIKLPFENLMFNKFTGTNLQVAYALKNDFTKYIPKPVILYLYERASCSFHFDNGTSNTTITNYNVFGQDVKYQENTHTLNWGVEYSSYLLTLINNTLFTNYYLAYLSNLYTLKARMLKVKMRLPYNELINLKLNDRIVIRDKRYVINQFTTDLTNYEVSLELLQDFRTLNFYNSQLIRSSEISKDIIINTTSILPLTWSVFSDPNNLILAVVNNQDSVLIKIQSNTSGVQRSASITSNLNDKIIIIQDA